MGSIYRPKYRSRKSKQVRQSRIYWIQYYLNGKAERENTHLTDHAAAKRLLQSREGDAARGVPVSARIGQVKIDELIADVVTNYQINRKKSVGHVERRIRKHILPFFSGRRAATISTADVERFILARQQARASNAEINRELAIVKRAFSLGARGGKILTKPYIPALKENKVRKGFFEPRQFQAVLRYLSLPLRALMTFFWITGWRKSDVLWLQWRQVDFLNGTVMEVVGHHWPTARAALAPFAATASATFLFPLPRRSCGRTLSLRSRGAWPASRRLGLQMRSARLRKGQGRDAMRLRILTCMLPPMA